MEAVAYGVASTARIITGAALIIIAVFVGFAAGDQVEFQQMGFGVAVSLLIDATVVRLVLLPAVLAILGERTWYLPRWLGWLPHLEIEGAGAGLRPVGRPRAHPRSDHLPACSPVSTAPPTMQTGRLLGEEAGGLGDRERALRQPGRGLGCVVATWGDVVRRVRVEQRREQLDLAAPDRQLPLAAAVCGDPAVLAVVVRREQLSIVPKRDGLTLTVRGGQRSASMSATEWTIASQVTRSACGSSRGIVPP